jgi:hypothetical protein
MPYGTQAGREQDTPQQLRCPTAHGDDPGRTPRGRHSEAARTKRRLLRAPSSEIRGRSRSAGGCGKMGERVGRSWSSPHRSSQAITRPRRGAQGKAPCTPQHGPERTSPARRGDAQHFSPKPGRRPGDMSQTHDAHLLYADRSGSCSFSRGLGSATWSDTGVELELAPRDHAEAGPDAVVGPDLVPRALRRSMGLRLDVAARRLGRRARPLALPVTEPERLLATKSITLISEKSAKNPRQQTTTDEKRSTADDVRPHQTRPRIRPDTEASTTASPSCDLSLGYSSQPCETSL